MSELDDGLRTLRAEIEGVPHNRERALPGPLPLIAPTQPIPKVLARAILGNLTLIVGPTAASLLTHDHAQNPMSNPSPQLLEAEAHANDADVQLEKESLEQKLESIDINDPQSNTASEEPKIIKRSGRDLLEKLHRKRLGVNRINFTGGGTQASKGSHGEVVIATLTLDDGTSSEPTIQVAVKKFLISDMIDEEKFLRTFANELRIVDGLDHPNIIKLVGFVEDMENQMAWLVFPWEANGNVREFLLSGKWELPERVSLIRDVASGLAYLHTRRPPIRHGDLKSLNILVNSEHRAVITDFGSARILAEPRRSETASGLPRRQAASTKSGLTPDDGCPEVTVSAGSAELTLTGPSWSFRWAAPEILNEEEPCLASDIWALGWIAWEIVTDNYPFPEAKTSKSITVKVVTGLLPELYDDVQLSQITNLCYLMVRCWKSEPRERISATECWRAIQWVPSTIPRARTDGTAQIRSAALLVEMGDIHRLHCRNQAALECFGDAVAIAQSAGDEETMARALYLAVDSHLMLCNYDKAEESCNQSLAIYTNLGNSLGRAEALFKLGKIHLSRHDYTGAEESFNQALAIYRGAYNYCGQANVMLRLGQTHRARSKFPEAEISLNKALSIYTSIGSSLGQANTLDLLGEVHQARSNNVEAEKCFNQALVISVSIGYSFGQANALQRLGEVHQARSGYPHAEELFKQALNIFTTIGNSLGRANSLLGLGEVLLRQARYSEAKTFLNDAAEVSDTIDYKSAQIRSKKLLAEVFEAEESLVEASP